MPRIGLCPGLDEPPCLRAAGATAVFAGGANNSYGKVEERPIRGVPWPWFAGAAKDGQAMTFRR
jgi:hypothetical protein